MWLLSIPRSPLPETHSFEISNSGHFFSIGCKKEDAFNTMQRIIQLKIAEEVPRLRIVALLFRQQF
jgi:hypothetical protein